MPDFRAEFGAHLKDVAGPLRQLDEELTRAVDAPPVDAVIRRAVAMNRTTTAAAATVLTVGMLGAVTIAAQSVSSGTIPLPAPIALAPMTPFAPTDPATPPPVVADVLNPGEMLVRMNPGVPAPPGARRAAYDTTVLPRGTRAADAEPVDPSARPETWRQGREAGRPEGTTPTMDRPGEVVRPDPQVARILPGQGSQQQDTPKFTKPAPDVSRSLPRQRPRPKSESGGPGGLLDKPKKDKKKDKAKDTVRSLTDSGKDKGGLGKVKPLG